VAANNNFKSTSDTAFNSSCSLVLRGRTLITFSPLIFSFEEIKTIFFSSKSKNPIVEIST
jgi:hypothetical protein